MPNRWWTGERDEGTPTADDGGAVPPDGGLPLGLLVGLLALIVAATAGGFLWHRGA